LRPINYISRFFGSRRPRRPISGRLIGGRGNDYGRYQTPPFRPVEPREMVITSSRNRARKERVAQRRNLNRLNKGKLPRKYLAGAQER